MNRAFIIILLLFSLLHINCLGSPFEIETIDKIYDPDIKTVRLYPLVDHPDRELQASAAPLNNTFTLLLEFDHLFSEYETYYVKFIHCNADWSPSRLFSLDYLNDYNEFPIEEYEFSFNTKVSYVHYQFELPEFKIPGNYVLVVYRESESNITLTKRFMIYDNQTGLVEKLWGSGINPVSRSTQTIGFDLEYKGRRIDNPQRNVRVTIRQNQRWDNAIYSLSPTNVNESAGIIEYNHFAGENQFDGGNQFRFFDLRSLRYFGRNVESVNLQSKVPIARLEADKARGVQSYAENDDYNGKYLIAHPFESDYALVEFFLEAEELSDAKVFVSGSFTQWSRDRDYQLEYLKDRGGYFGVFLLKQGFYNYQYLVEASSDYKENYFEGDHFETENEYDLLVYYYSFQQDIDLLIGYFTVTKNPRF